MGMQYTDVVVTGSGPRGTALSLTMAMVDSTTGPEVTGKRWFDCAICGLSFPRSAIRFYLGRPYGVPCTDAQDIAQLARRASANTRGRSPR